MKILIHLSMVLKPHSNQFNDFFLFLVDRLPAVQNVHALKNVLIMLIQKLDSYSLIKIVHGRKRMCEA